MAAQMPMLMQQMQDPRFQQMLSNPRALQAMLQVQQGMQSLQSEAPGLFAAPGLVCEELSGDLNIPLVLFRLCGRRSSRHAVFRCQKLFLVM